MAKWKVRIKGIGKMGNDVRQLDKSIEIDEQTMKDLQNTSRRDAVLSGLLLVHYPGIEVDIKKIGLQYEEVKENLLDKKVGTVGSSVVAGAVGGVVGGAIANKNKKQNTKAPDDTAPLGENLKEITNYVWNGNIEDTKQKLRNITIQMTGHKWEVNPSSEIAKENNRILSRCVEQYKQGFKYYKVQTELNEFKRGLTRLRRKRFITKFWPYLLLVSIFLILLILLAISE